jgi:glycogen operon protein
MLGAFAAAISGSAEVFEPGDRSPFASINYVTSHDGFTLRDLVSYETRHNEDNGEQNKDGDDANWSRNWGAEGPTDSDSIEHLRWRVMRSLVATLACSQGVPMLLHGDELGRTQLGNNNAYCQDNTLSWLDWNLDVEGHDFLEFVRRAFALRGGAPLLRRGLFFSGRPGPDGCEKDVIWLRPDGHEMKAPDWHDPEARVLGMLIPRECNPEEDEEGHAVSTETLLAIFNAGARTVRFRLPVRETPGVWHHTLCSAGSVERPLRGASLPLPPRSASLLTYREPS